jgi:hypothetical protein
VHETQLAAGAEDDEFGVEFGQYGEVLEVVRSGSLGIGSR